MIQILSRSPAETKLLAQALAKWLQGGEVIALTGSLGSGKTTFIKGLGRGLKIRENIASPTFVIMIPYKIPGRERKTFYHFDLHRIKKARELIELGFQDIVQNPKAIAAIEWPEVSEELLPKRALRLKFAHGKKPHERIIQIL